MQTPGPTSHRKVKAIPRSRSLSIPESVLTLAVDELEMSGQGSEGAKSAAVYGAQYNAQRKSFFLEKQIAFH